MTAAPIQRGARVLYRGHPYYVAHAYRVADRQILTLVGEDGRELSTDLWASQVTPLDVPAPAAEPVPGGSQPELFDA